jgi:hypothetical protein
VIHINNLPLPGRQLGSRLKDDSLLSQAIQQAFPLRGLVRLLTVWLVSAPAVTAQVVFEVPYASAADLRVHVVPYESQADLCVYRVAYATEAVGNKGYWYFAKTTLRADKRIFFVQWPSQADLKICWVPFRGRAGWRNPDRRKLLEQANDDFRTYPRE